MTPSSRSSRLARGVSALLLLQATLTGAQVQFNANSYSSIRAFTKLLGDDIMSIYVGDQPGQTPGLLPGSGTPGGYYWWVGGGMFGMFINYWHHTGDTEWVDATREAIVVQSSPANGGYFEPPVEQLQLGNDDISFWAFAAMEAAEYKFPNPKPSEPQYLEMVQGVFNRQVERWDAATCGGGLRWQVFSTNPGYDYKNSISNGCFFQIGARLAKYTGNQTYAKWAEKAYDWTKSMNLIDDQYNVYDGVNVTLGCKIGPHIAQYSYNVGVFLYGCAALWNMSEPGSAEATKWETRTKGFLDAAQQNFFKQDENGNPVLTESVCETIDACNVDMSTFKGYLARWLRVTAQVAPWSEEQVTSMLQYSAPAAAAVCTQAGGDGGLQCGQQWYTGQFDGRTGIGMNMNAMEVMQTLIPASAPLTAKTGGNSKGNPNAGADSSLNSGAGAFDNVIIPTTGDKAGAAILTILLAAGTFSGAWWIVK